MEKTKYDTIRTLFGTKANYIIGCCKAQKTCRISDFSSIPPISSNTDSVSPAEEVFKSYIFEINDTQFPAQFLITCDGVVCYIGDKEWRR